MKNPILSRCLLISMAVMFLAASSGFAQQILSQKTAVFNSDGSYTDATWTMPSNTSGTYKYQPIVAVSGYTYVVEIYDNTIGGQPIARHFFTATEPACDATTPTVSLTSGHNYTMHVDLLLGSPPPTLQVMAKATIFYLCGEQ